MSSQVQSTLQGIQGAFSLGSSPTPVPQKAKQVTQAEIKAQKEQEARTQNTILQAQALTGGRVNAEILSEAQEKLGNAPTATQLSRETGMTFKELEAQIPAALQSEQIKFQIQSQAIQAQQMQLAAEVQQIEAQIQQAQADAAVTGVPADTTALTERREQLSQQSMQLQGQTQKLQNDSSANTTALLLKQQQIEEARKAKAKQNEAFIKDAQGKAQAQDKPVKMRTPTVSFSTAGDEGEAE